MTIFRSVDQALRFAYAMEAYPVMPRSQMAIIMQRYLRNFGQREGSSGIDFAGLDALEMHGQCAMIRAEVKRVLNKPERWAIEAQFGVNEDLQDGKRTRLTFSDRRMDAVMGLARYLKSVIPVELPDLAVDMLLGRIVDNRVMRTTCRELADDFRCSHTSVLRYERELTQRVHQLEAKGVGDISPRFYEAGIVAAL